MAAAGREPAPASTPHGLRVLHHIFARATKKKYKNTPVGSSLDAASSSSEASSTCVLVCPAPLRPTRATERHQGLSLPPGRTTDPTGRK
mmetsp:Transcript_6631/g.17337  ORF Transcript_6631/g.17337 Transcript_6631/m.17337 type:complete len:89 (+) Transcript_6631:732-998(+)